MSGYNKVVMVGNLTKDPQTRYLESGVAVNDYFIAVGRPYKNAQGIEETDFFKIVCWRKLAEFSEKYLKKGDRVLIEGNLRTDTYQKEGETRFATKITAEKIRFMSGGKKRREEGGPDIIKNDTSSASGTEEPDFEDVPF